MQVALGSGMRPARSLDTSIHRPAGAERVTGHPVSPEGAGQHTVFTPSPYSERWRPSAQRGDPPAPWSAHLGVGPGSRTAGGSPGDARAHPSLRTFSALQDPTDVLGLSLGSQTRDTATQRPSTAHKQSGHGCSGTISRNLGPQHVNSLPPTHPN